MFAKEIECSAEEAETVIGWVIGADSDRQTARAVRLFALRAIRQLMLPGPDRRSLRWRARYAILEHVALAVQEAVPQGLPPSGKHP